MRRTLIAMPTSSIKGIELRKKSLKQPRSKREKYQEGEKAKLELPNRSAVKTFKVLLTESRKSIYLMLMWLSFTESLSRLLAKS